MRLADVIRGITTIGLTTSRSLRLVEKTLAANDTGPPQPGRRVCPATTTQAGLDAPSRPRLHRIQSASQCSQCATLSAVSGERRAPLPGWRVCGGVVTVVRVSQQVAAGHTAGHSRGNSWLRLVPERCLLPSFISAGWTFGCDSAILRVTLPLSATSPVPLSHSPTLPPCQSSHHPPLFALSSCSILAPVTFYPASSSSRSVNTSLQDAADVCPSPTTSL